MKFSELKNKKKVSAFVRDPFNTRIVFKVEEQMNAITEKDIYKMHTKYKWFTLEFWVVNQEDVDFWKLE